MSDDELTTVAEPDVLTEPDVALLCEAGALAPSGGNIQPWRVQVDGNALKLALDPVRAHSFLDVGHYASIYALGSFLENVCIASETLGLLYTLEVGPFRDLEDAFVTLTYTGRAAEPREHPLHAQLARRCTNRQMSDGTIIQDAAIDRLKEALGSEEYVKLSYLVDESDRKSVANILGKADVIRTKHDVLAGQMFDELRFTSKDATQTKDGIDVDTLEMPSAAIAFVQKLRDYPTLRRVLPGKLFEGFAQEPLSKSSHVCLVSLKRSPNSVSLIEAGRAVQRLWLKATELNLAVQPMTVLPFLMLRSELFGGDGFSSKDNAMVVSLAKRLRGVFHITPDEIPLFLFRLSRASEPSQRALRRPWRDFTTLSK